MADDSQEQLPLECAPRLRREVQCRTTPDGLVLSTDVQECTIGGAPGELLLQIARALDGRRPLAALAGDLGVDEPSIQHLATELYRRGLASDDSPVSLPGLLFYDHARSSNRVWCRATPEAEAIRTSQGDSRLAALTLVEHWQFIRTNPTYLSAVTSTAPVETRGLWARFAAEEHDHGDWLYEGLCRLFTREQLAASAPLWETAAITRLFQSVARADELAFAALLATAERSADTVNDLGSDLTRYRAMEEQGLLPPGVLEPFIRHAVTDSQMDHLAHTRAVFRFHPSISHARRRSIMRVMWDGARVVSAAGRAVHDFWKDPANGWLPMGPDESPVLEPPPGLRRSGTPEAAPAAAAAGTPGGRRLDGASPHR